LANPVLVEVTRGPAVESGHRAAAAVGLASGETLLEFGDTSRAVFPRSAIKAFQALPLIAAGGAGRFGLTDAEISLLCASHNGEPKHVAAARSILRKIGLTEASLECGAHWPRGEFGHALAAGGRRPGAIHNNCSGKHASMLALAKLLGADPRGYVRPDHPVQRRIAGTIDALCDIRTDAVPSGIDGCSVPTWAIPIRNLARGFARFATGEGLCADLAAGAARIRVAVAAAPDMVAGQGRFCTGVMEITGARAFVKAGAEGVICAALPERGLGIVVKCDDGAARAAEVVMAHLLLAYGAVEPDARAFDRFLIQPLRNCNGIHTGDVRAAAALIGALAPASTAMIA
jgi:L-asparaginase II